MFSVHRNWFKSNRLVYILIFYIILAVIILPRFQYQINPDGIVYISVAKTYLNGNWAQAIDTYHSPLISWLLIPFLSLDPNPAAALFFTKLLSVLVGFFTIIGFWLLSSRFGLDKNFKTVLTVGMVILAIYFAFSVITPDLLLVCNLIYYLYFLLDPKYSQKLFNGAFCGLFGALAYFAKSYALPFFLVHFCLINAIYYLNESSIRINIVKNLLLGILVFFLISGGWIGLISDKENKLTYGTAGEFNQDLVGPNSKGWVLPQIGGDFSEVESWSPFESWANFKYQMRIIYGNLLQILNFLQYFSYFSILILLFYIVLCIRPFSELIKSYKLLIPLLTIIIFCGGYTPILVEERYLWLVWVLLLLMGGYLLDGLFQTEFFNKYQKTILVLIFSFSFIIAPITYLDTYKDSGEDIYQIQKAITLPIAYGKSASNGGLDRSLYLSYYLGTDYVGQAGFKGNYSGLEKQLTSSKVDLYFLWDDETEPSLENYTEINKGKLKGVKVYSRI